MSTREWGVGYDEGYQKGWNDAMNERPAEASEPVAYIEHHKAGDNLVWDNPGKNSSALYTTPPQQDTIQRLSALVRAQQITIEKLEAQSEQEPTYTSTQPTNCAGCGEHKHTPLRIDAMGGYVCLTCIDKQLGTMLGEFGYAQDSTKTSPKKVGD